jgi:hypothetical protein
LLLLAGLTAWGCGRSAVAPGPAWLAARPEEQVLQLERHLRGFDVAMMEVGYRYVELYWAGRDGNWEAAAYHTDKIRLAIENGLERRPKRTASARPFLDGPLAAMGEALAGRDPQRFATRFEGLTAGCNACHAQEKVDFFEVRPPGSRLSPIRRAGGAASE